MRNPLITTPSIPNPLISVHQSRCHQEIIIRKLSRQSLCCLFGITQRFISGIGFHEFQPFRSPKAICRTPYNSITGIPIAPRDIHSVSREYPLNRVAVSLYVRSRSANQYGHCFIRHLDLQHFTVDYDGGDFSIFSQKPTGKRIYDLILLPIIKLLIDGLEG